MKKTTCLLGAFCLLTYSISAQSWFNMMRDQKTNVHDVKRAFYNWYNQQPANTDADSKVEESEENGNYMLFKRWEWLMDVRTYPTGNRPKSSDITLAYQKYLAGNANQRVSNVQTAANWSYVGNVVVPGNGGGDGRVNRLRFMPGNNNTIYACAATGGLWVTTNGGTTWAPKTDRLLDLSTMDVAIDPSNTNILYLATGDGDGIYGGYTTISTNGVMKSTDGGNTWNPTGLFLNQAITGPAFSTINTLAINPNTTNVLLAATSFGLYYTSNAASSWTKILSGNFKDVALEPGHPNIAYATEDNGMFYRSTNGGITWTRITAGLPRAYSGSSPYNEERMSIGVTPADSNYVYLLVTDTNSSGFLGLYLSSNDGVSFTRQSNTPNVIGQQGWYTLSIGVSTTNASDVIVGGLDTYYSTNKGVNWTQTSSWVGAGGNYVHADVHSLAFVPGSATNVYVGCDGGVFKTTNINSNNSWVNFSNNLEISEQYSIGPSASNATLWLTGWQDNGTNSSSAGWSQVMGGDGMVCFIDYTNNNNMFAEYYSGQLQRSTNGGASWGGASSGINEQGPWVTKWMQDPKTANNLFGGFVNVWKNTNKGSVAWTKISSWGNSSSDVSAIAVSPTNDNYMYASNWDSVYYTTNGGTTWKNITAGLPVSQAAVDAIAISPLNTSHVWVGLSGYSGANKVFYSANAGVTWKNISVNLPNLPVNCLLYQNASPDGIYAGTDRGVYYHDTVINAWVNYSNNLPNVIVNDLRFASNGNLLAATFGRGTWETPTYTPPATKPTVYFSAFPRTFCVADTVQFMDSSLNQPNSWSWRFPGGNPSTSNLQNPLIVYSTAGNYPVTLIATNAHGTDSSTKANFITVYALTVPNITQLGSVLTCTPPGMVYYQWYYPNGNPIPGATSSTYTFGAQGRYICAITNANGCTDTVSFQTSIPLGLNDASQNGYMNIYPNPTSGDVQVVFNLPQANDYSVSITDVLGQVLYAKEMYVNSGYSTVMNMSGYGKGVYFISLNGNGIRAVKKIIVL